MIRQNPVSPKVGNIVINLRKFEIRKGKLGEWSFLSLMKQMLDARKGVISKKSTRKAMSW